MGVLNLLGKSGFINREPLVQDIAELAGVDPSELLVNPNAPPAQPLTITVRGADDLRDPMMLALSRRACGPAILVPPPAVA